MQSDKRMVIALGGNALGKTPEEQLTLIGAAAEAIVDLMDGGYNVTVTHGNGPQVGMIKVATDVSADKGGGTPLIPFAECGAMSQGYIGYHLQQAIGRELKKRGSDKQCVSVVTQTVVDVQDPAFQNPTKPVGAFFSEERAKELMAETGNTYVEDAGRGWRWVVPSPLPSAIVEAATVKTLIDAGAVVVASGGGGIPVVEDGDGYKGVAAVIDKDRSAALLASDIGAELLVILTAVDRVSLNYNTPDQTDLESMTVEEARKHIDEDQFAKGSMLPKVEACLNFVEGGEGRKALITSLVRAKDALAGRTGTYITM